MSIPGDTTLFYCWQSDLPSKANRFFIKAALEKALKTISSKKPEMSLKHDEDARGAQGTVDIPTTLLRKIAGCSVFVCDISIVNRHGEAGRLMPNPNVMFELGYAVATVGWERIICIFNSQYGDFRDLPFDFGWRSLIRYDLGEDAPADARSERLKQTANHLAASIEEILARAPRQKDVSDLDRIVAHELRDVLINIRWPVIIFLMAKLEETHAERRQLLGQLLYCSPPNAPGSELPTPALTKPILAELNDVLLLQPCLHREAPKGVAWVEWFVATCAESAAMCNKVIDRHSRNASPRLVAQLETVAKVVGRHAVTIQQIARGRPGDLFKDYSGLGFIEEILLVVMRAERVWREEIGGSLSMPPDLSKLTTRSA